MKLIRNALSTIILTAISPLCVSTSLAARLEEVHGRFHIDNTNVKHGPTEATLNVQAKARRHAEILELGPESTFELLASSNEREATHYRYQQLFRGVPVYGATVKISEDQGGHLRTLFGNVARDLSRDLASTAANLTPQQALTIAKRTALIGENANMPTEGETSDKVIYIGDDDVAVWRTRRPSLSPHPRSRRRRQP